MGVSGSNSEGRWGSPEERERRNRVLISIYAYAYELRDDSIVTDAEFDTLAQKINPEVSTGHDALDTFFKEEFSAFTGQWIHKHPELDKVANKYQQIRSQRAKSTK